MRSIARALVALALCSMVLPWTARRGEGLPLYAARTGLMCQSCHFDPNGGGPRTDFGFAFASHRHTIEPETTGTWKDLALTNRVSESMPVYFGLDQRFMLLSNANVTSSPAERAGFFNMENALYVSFQPHPRLALVYSRDAFNDATLAQDAFGVISGFPLDGYLKAGRFRTPFGLRMDDHTVATREGYLNLTGGPAFLPYDPRFPDMGVEIGGDHGSVFGRAAFTNGNSNVFGPQPFAHTATAKLGVNLPWVQTAVSVHDDYEKNAKFPFRRARRWSTYALTHWKRLVFIGEVGAGTDDFAKKDIRGAHNNLLAGFGEIDWTVNRALNLRVRADHLETSRDGTEFTRPDGSMVSIQDVSSFDRWSLEGEILPVPFGEIRASYRVISPVAKTDIAGEKVRTERQGYLQFHFSY